MPFGNFTLNSVLYDIKVTRLWRGCTCLRLFDVEGLDESLVHDAYPLKSDVRHNLTLFLYPDDSDEKRPAFTNLPTVFFG